MSIIDALIDSAEHVVELSGIEWKLRRLRSRDLAVAGHAQLFALLTPEDVASVVETARAGDRPDLSSLATSVVDRLRSMPDTARVRMANAQDAMVCAGVVAVRDPGSAADWTPIKIVSERPSNQIEGVVNVAALSDGLRRALADAVQVHSSAEGGLADALASFRAR